MCVCVGGGRGGGIPNCKFSESEESAASSPFSVSREVGGRGVMNRNIVMGNLGWGGVVLGNLGWGGEGRAQLTFDIFLCQ